MAHRLDKAVVAFTTRGKHSNETHVVEEMAILITDPPLFVLGRLLVKVAHGLGLGTSLDHHLDTNSIIFGIDEFYRLVTVEHQLFDDHVLVASDRELQGLDFDDNVEELYVVFGIRKKKKNYFFLFLAASTCEIS